MCRQKWCWRILMQLLQRQRQKDIGGKVLAIFFPILAFVVSGFEHCVANMYYIPAGFFTMINFCRLLLKISLAVLLWLVVCAFICMGRQRDNGNIEM